jgi:hypothetical protein
MPLIVTALCPTSDKARYVNFAGRDGAALSGLKTACPERHRYPLLLILGKAYKKQLLIGGGNACSDWGILGYLCQAAVSIGHGWNSVRPIRYGSASCQRSLCTFLGCQRWVSDRFASCFCMHQPSRRCVTSDSWHACSPASRRGSPRCPRPRTVRKGLRRASTRR